MWDAYMGTLRQLALLDVEPSNRRPTRGEAPRAFHRGEYAFSVVLNSFSLFSQERCVPFPRCRWDYRPEVFEDQKSFELRNRRQSNGRATRESRQASMIVHGARFL